MADSEFEEFRHYFERLPQHLKAPLSNYTLVHDVTLDDSPTSSQGSDGEVGRSCDGVAGDSEDEDVVVIHRHDNQSGHTSADDSEDLDNHCSIVADSDFRLVTSWLLSENTASNRMVNGSLAHIRLPLGDISLFGGLSSRGRSAGGPGPGGGGTSSSGNGGRDSVVSDVGDSCSSLSSWPTPEHIPANRPGSGSGERRRRRLPEIPKAKKCIPIGQMSMQTSSSLADELNAATGSTGSTGSNSGRPHLVLRKCHPRLRHEDSSPDSERIATDSGHSTAHSPDNGPKSVSPIPCNTLQNTDSVSPSSTPGPTVGSGGVPFTQLELLEATHRGLHKFVPRHHDEIDLEIGDPIYVQKEADDLWCEGVNLRTGRQGIFPSAYAVDMDYSDFDPSAPKVKRERYLLGYLGSVETLAHKGTGVVCQAVRRIVGNSSEESPISQSCILEVSDQGLRMVDRSKPRKNQGPCHDYFYSLKNVSFCAFHPRDHRYLGFITKHPTLQRFACHVFIGQESTRPVAEAVGRAFHRFYTKFIETAFPIEDIYIE
ncbi:JNK-interacting protein 1-like isoform X1 [Vespa mandarinia]|uniref:JNK-interacting protein 1-like isoform X1 n=1 Tax=Vespa mandarinia TaxID=7446 RepID=UPI00161ED2A8|nr:JNK-interacting protein 1-like isoform X1 [Vespa mandarinia]XP_047363739.1 JNK-interacting protein 1 isoform X1 [Vespa velutina]